MKSILVFSLSLFLAIVVVQTSHAQKIWVGAFDDNWHNPLNWSGGTLPTDSDDIIIPGPPTNEPFISAEVIVRSIHIHAGGWLIIEDGDFNVIVEGSESIGILSEGQLVNRGNLFVFNSAGSGIVSYGNTYLYGNLDVFNTGYKGVFAETGTLVIEKTTFNGNNITPKITIYDCFNNALEISNGVIANIKEATIKIGKSPFADGADNVQNGLYNQSNLIIEQSTLEFEYTDLPSISNTITGSLSFVDTDIDIRASTNNGILNTGMISLDVDSYLSIDSVDAFGIRIIDAGSFDNYGTIEIGMQDTIGSSGLRVEDALSTFNNYNILKVERTNFDGIQSRNQGIFKNYGDVIVGPTGGVCRVAVFLDGGGTFLNIGGYLSSEHTLDGVIYSFHTSSSNTIINTDGGVIAGYLESSPVVIPVRSIIDLAASTNAFINESCSKVIIGENAILRDLNDGITNNGTIVDYSDLDCEIHINNGMVYNLNGGNFVINTNTGTLTTEDEIRWTGCRNSDWKDLRNWTTSLPASSDHVIIAPGDHDPILSDTDTITSIEIESSAYLNIDLNGQLFVNNSLSTGLEIDGELDIYGLVEINNPANHGCIVSGELSLIGGPSELEINATGLPALLNESSGRIYLDPFSDLVITQNEMAGTGTGLVNHNVIENNQGNIYIFQSNSPIGPSLINQDSLLNAGLLLAINWSQALDTMIINHGFLSNTQSLIAQSFVNTDQIGIANFGTLDNLAGAELNSFGELNILAASGIIINDGLMTIDSSLIISNDGTVLGNGEYEIDNHFVLDGGTFTAESSKVSFVGEEDSKIQGEPTFNEVTIDKTSGIVILESEVNFDGDLNMHNGNIDLNGNALKTSSGRILNESPNSYITTSGTSFFSAGFFQYTGNLNAPNEVDPANIGFEITTDVNLGQISISRIPINLVLAMGAESISRTYLFSRTNSTDTLSDVTVRLKYFEHELNGVDEALIVPFGSGSIFSSTIEHVMQENDTQQNFVSLGNLYNSVLTLGNAQSNFEMIWTGNVNESWKHPLNWNIFGEPSRYYNVTIPSTMNDPVLYLNNNGSCSDIVIETNATLRVLGELRLFD